jgi:hypothetical protein
MHTAAVFLGLARTLHIYTVYDRTFGGSLPTLYIWFWPTLSVMFVFKCTHLVQ